VLIRDYIIGAIIFTMFIVGGLSILNEFIKSEDRTLVSNESVEFVRFNTTFNRMNNLTSSIGGLQSSVNRTAGDEGLFGVLNSLIQGSWQTLKGTFATFGFMTTVFYSLSDVFPFIPRWVSSLVVLIISTMIIYVIFSAIYQKDV